MTKKELTLCPMIGVAGKDRGGAVKLFGEKNTHNLVRPGHPAEREAPVTPSESAGSKTVRPAYQENSPRDRGGRILGEARGKGVAVDQISARIEGDDPIAIAQSREHGGLFGGNTVLWAGGARFSHLFDRKAAQAEFWAAFACALKISLA